MNFQMDVGSDLDVERISDALSGRKIDVVVSGSIAAVESVRFIRTLRRLGATVTPWLTAGGSQFITPTALSWAAGCEVRSTFAGSMSHIALGHACIVAPASASFIAKLSQGVIDAPALALATSYLGKKLPVLVLPTMHASLSQAPAVAENIEKLRSMGVCILDPRIEEGKEKFPEPKVLSDQCAHILNQQLTPQIQAASVLLTMGTTRGYIDDVRYFSNYSSGALGSLITEELFRLGLNPHVVWGPCEILPTVYSSLTRITTVDEMEMACQTILKNGADAAVLAASVLDFTPKSKATGKIPSKSNEELQVNLVRTKKIIAGIHPKSGTKVGFKLESGISIAESNAIAEDYMQRYGLSLFVVNDLKDVDRNRHVARIYEKTHKTLEIQGKMSVARAIAAHVKSRAAAAHNSTDNTQRS